MRILMISDHADPLVDIGSKESGGQNIYVLYLSQFLARQGVFVDIYTRWDRKNKKEVIKKNEHIRVIRVKAGPKKYMQRDKFLNVIDEFADNVYKRTRKEKLKYDIIHSNYWFSGLIGLNLKEKLKISQVHVFHSIGKVRFRTLKKFITQKEDRIFFKKRLQAEDKIAKHVTSIISTSPVEKQIIKRLFKIDGEKIKTIPIGVDFDVFRPISKKKARNKLKLPLEKKIILYVGRIEWRKGIGTLLYALKKVLDSHSRAMLCIVGGGESKTEKKLEEKEIKHLNLIIRKLNLRDKVRFLGSKRQNKLYLYYSAADVCAVPSYYEPFGIVPLESMACGTPVVGSKTGGLKYTIKDKKTGYLAEPRNYKELANKLNLVLYKNEKYFYKHCIKRVNKIFDWEKISKNYNNYFKKIIKIK